MDLNRFTEKAQQALAGSQKRIVIQIQFAVRVDFSGEFVQTVIAE